MIVEPFDHDLITVTILDASGSSESRASPWDTGSHFTSIVILLEDMTAQDLYPVVKQRMSKTEDDLDTARTIREPI